MSSRPSTQITLDARNLRGIAHPVRVRILTALRTDGPATASDLARSLNLNTGATSYHLRQLAQHGFVVDEPVRGIRRQRWWRAAHDNTSVPANEVGTTFLRTLAQVWCDSMFRAIDATPKLPARRRDAQDFSDYALRLTPAQARRLIEQIHGILRGVADEPGGVPYTVQLQVFPTPPAPEG
ncbi:hypothetical protein Rhe02_76710 [Rhizocola hellebori]|uniref:HTH arsR-type domain-containing protein n=1 Tax=Rhizocola hellebori TaxID=1392758 RepID=A0A8J3QH93_9ACTN|nr:winged helix-turn-helix domain-containing protein [Rhizocola hellebori]GIH09604.1 hypothetical protein Rhe02_76710 [Rhizocola hellebori]